MTIKDKRKKRRACGNTKLIAYKLVLFLFILGDSS